MSKISELGDKYQNLPKILLVYETELTDANEKLKITGKKLEVANSENSAWMHYYDQRRVELHTLIKFFTAEQSRVRSELYKSYNENYSRALSSVEINKYIDSEESYLFVHMLLIEVEELYEMYKSVVDSFTSRNYTLSNITKIRVASLEHIEI